MNVRARLGMMLVLASVLALVMLLAPTLALAELPSDYNTVVTVEGRTPGDLYFQADPLNPVPVVIYSFNTVTPAITFTAATTESVSTTVPVTIGGFSYTVDRQPGQILARPGVPSTSTPPFTSYAPITAGLQGVPLSDGHLQLAGWLARQAAPYVAPPGKVLHDPREGLWFLHAQSIASNGWNPPYGKEAVSPFFIDVTRPLGPIRNIHIVREAGASNVVSQTVCDVLWDNSGYDELSGDASWDVKLNGGSLTNFYNVQAWPTAAFTVENLNPGLNTLQIACVDFAGNVGPYTSYQIFSDPDTPTVAFTRPTGTIIGIKPTITVDAVDKGGIKSVVYQLDGVTIASPTTAPYSITPNLSSFATGAHVLSVTVTDMMDRTATATKNVTLDKTPPPVLSGFKVSVNKRVVTLSTRVSKPCVILFGYNTNYNAATPTYVQKTAYSPGTYSVKFTVPKPAPKSHVYYLGASVPYAVQAMDVAGNESNLISGRVKVRFFKLVRTGRNKVRVVNY